MLQDIRASKAHRCCLQNLEFISNMLRSLNVVSPTATKSLEHANLCITSKWPELEAELKDFHEQVRDSLEAEDEFYEHYETLSEWLDALQDIVLSLKRSENYEIFKEAWACYEVKLNSRRIYPFNREIEGFYALQDTCSGQNR